MKRETIYLLVPVSIRYETPAGRKDALRESKSAIWVEFGGVGAGGSYRGKSVGRVNILDQDDVAKARPAITSPRV